MAKHKAGRTKRSRRGRSMARSGTKRGEQKVARRLHALQPAAAALAEDHRRIEALLGAYVASADDNEKQRLIEEICAALIVHTAIEEQIFYPACRDGLPQDDIIDVAQVEHDGTKVLIADLLDGDSDDAYRNAKWKCWRRRFAITSPRKRSPTAFSPRPRSTASTRTPWRGVSWSESRPCRGALRSYDPHASSPCNKPRKWRMQWQECRATSANATSAAAS